MKTVFQRKQHFCIFCTGVYTKQRQNTSKRTNRKKQTLSTGVLVEECLWIKSKDHWL